MNQRGILVVVSGFSGAGKGTLMKELLKRYDNYALSISATTRSPRERRIPMGEWKVGLRSPGLVMNREPMPAMRKV